MLLKDRCLDQSLVMQRVCEVKAVLHVCACVCVWIKYMNEEHAEQENMST